MKTDKRKTGDKGEKFALKWLESKGYRIVKTNYSKRFGEIDIVAWHQKPHFGKTLCFIEVKTRQYDSGDAERATRGDKLKRIKRAATLFCLENGIYIDTTPIQFEQISVYTDTSPSFCRHYIIPIDK